VKKKNSLKFGKFGPFIHEKVFAQVKIFFFQVQIWQKFASRRIAGRTSQLRFPGFGNVATHALDPSQSIRPDKHKHRSIGKIPV
jgi:hypothetical protein